MRLQVCKVSRSRLMGTLGLRLQWKINELETFDQFFLLEVEEEGIEDYTSFINASEKEIIKEENRLFGSLGEKTIRISRKEAFSLLYDFARINISHNKSLPEPKREYEKFLIKDVSIHEGEFFQKISKKIHNPIELLNYATMRFIGNDIQALKHLSLEDTANLEYNKEGGTLLHNQLTMLTPERYIGDAIFEKKEKIYAMKLGLSIAKIDKEFKLRSIVHINDFPVEQKQWEAAMIQGEYLGYFKIKNGFGLQNLINIYPTLFQIPYDKGMMLVKYYNHNQHVQHNPYLISDDLEGVFFLGHNELLFSAIREEDFEKIMTILLKESELEIMEELHFDYPILYEYAENEVDGFMEFMQNYIT